MSGSECSPLTESEGDRRMLAEWASECVERVSAVFEERHPEDDRPRKAVEATRAFARGEIGIGAARRAAVAEHAAARSVTDPAERAAARAAGIAHMAGHARHAADYAVKAVSAAASSDRAAGAHERKWQYASATDPVRSLVYPEGAPD